jgi:hypothetical protein
LKLPCNHVSHCRGTFRHPWAHRRSHPAPTLTASHASAFSQLGWLGFGAWNVYLATGGSLAGLPPRLANPSAAAAAAAAAAAGGEGVMLGPLFLIDETASRAWVDAARRAAAWLETLSPTEVRARARARE